MMFNSSTGMAGSAEQAPASYLMTSKSGWHKLTDEERLERIHENRRARMERIDAMPPELRALVQDYGLPIIDTCTALGVTKARHIRHLVETVLDNFSPTRGTFSGQGVRTPLLEKEKSQ